MGRVGLFVQLTLQVQGHILSTNERDILGDNSSEVCSLEVHVQSDSAEDHTNWRWVWNRSLDGNHGTVSVRGIRWEIKPQDLDICKVVES